MTKSEVTRRRILRTAFEEFYRHGFQGGSLNRIVEEAQTTKGALFHHFSGKGELGYAVVDELIYPRICAEWVEPLANSTDPVKDIKAILRRFQEQCTRQTIECGCPLNNLSQEMSPLDEGFRHRIEAVYSAWRGALKEAFERGVAAGTVRNDLNPGQVAAFLVASFAGMVGTAKNAQSEALLAESGAGLIAYLNTLRT